MDSDPTRLQTPADQPTRPIAPAVKLGRPKRTWLGQAALALLALVVGVGLATAWQYRDYRHYLITPDPALTREVTIEITPGMNFGRIAEKLLMERVISNRTWFVLYGRTHGLARRLQAGQYTFRPGMTPLTMLDMISRGDVTTVKLTVPEGFTIFEIGRRLSTLGPWSAEVFIREAQSPERAQAVGSPVASLEGYLFPAVYELKMSMKEGDVVDMMVRRHLLERTPARILAAKQEDFTWHQVLTLASLLQKEAVYPDEMDTIAGVFMNRLKRHMPLQSDPTVVYGVRDFEGPIKKTDLLRNTPYNTYLNPGLPPGPICNPGVEAIDAALHPEDNDYLYFVADGSGRHLFAGNLIEHNRNVQTYRKKRREQEGN